MKKRVVFVFQDEPYVPVYEIEALEAENARLHTRLNMLAGKCETCGETCEDSILEHWIEKAKRYEAELKDVQSRVQEILADRETCQDCDEESLCFTCGQLFSADEDIKKTLEEKV